MSPITWFFVILTLVLVPVGIIAAIWYEMKKSKGEEGASDSDNNESGESA